MTAPQQTVECDVLVIGGAAAGLTAALEARARGVSVVVACKGKAGRSGNTVVAAGQFAAVVPYEGSPDSPQAHFEDTLKGGRNLNDETLLRLLADRSGESLLKLEEWGVRLLRLDGDFIRRVPPGHRHARGIGADASAFPYANSGLAITLPLRQSADRLGVRFLDDAPVLRMLLRDGRVRGALALDVGRGELVAIKAGAVVIAAGGAGRIFANTNNARGVCGDSYSLLLQAGATLRDMEFVQFYPSRMIHPLKCVVASPIFSDGAVLRDRHGDRFMPLYDPVNEDRTTRDIMSRAIFYEVQKGNGADGEVYLDATGVPEAVLERKYSNLTRDLRKQGVEPTRDWMKVAPTVHFVMGGAQVDALCWTGIPGLYAAGEAVGGVHGANRLSANALIETVVFGPIAGASAAGWAREHRVGGSVAFPELPMGGEAGPLDEVRLDLRRAMWDGASIVRSEASLRATLAKVLQCASAVRESGAPSAAALALREETRAMCVTAEAVVRSALARLESRGAHFREDFPTDFPEWLGSHLVRSVGGELSVEFAPKAQQVRTPVGGT